MERPLIFAMDGQAAPLPSVIQSGFVRLVEALHPWIDRKLGYFGDARFVAFYYEPRGDEVIWKDGLSYGFGTGGWSVFFDQIIPLAENYGVNVGGARSSGDDMLLIDRLERSAYFAQRESAERFLCRQRRAG